MVAQYAKKGRRQKASKGGRGSARVKDRKREKERVNFPRHGSFLTTVKLFLRLPVTGAPLFEFSPHPSHLTRVLSVRTLLASPHYPCVTSTQLLLLHVSPKKKKKKKWSHRSSKLPKNSNESLLELIIGLVGNDQHGVVASEWIHSSVGGLEFDSKYENI